MDELDRIAAEDFVPTNQDVLHTRVPTNGVVEVRFQVERTNFRVFDVGGQRSERRKWIHCFDSVNAIIFICALSEFDQKLVEDDQTNRLRESMILFKQICNSSVFSDNCSMILFLNKKDLFAEKIKKSSITIAFPEYKGNMSYEAQAKYIERRFERLNENTRRQIYAHYTCATDTNQVQVVLDSVVDTVMRANITNAGML
uniref:Uncharacterized protein n=1 Tax=Plectus sambesii TaxID=2011161 RepID=A0A914VUH3_9BILA